MTLEELLADIYALEEELLAFERKYGVRSEIFYAAYVKGSCCCLAPLVRPSYSPCWSVLVETLKPVNPHSGGRARRPRHPPACRRRRPA
jgi:hypothetical protein